jgi:hypothetical protein
VAPLRSFVCLGDLVGFVSGGARLHRKPVSCFGRPSASCLDSRGMRRRLKPRGWACGSG